jgi:dTDP-4-amino-4,6-dideoxygalactose transaminase
LGDYNEARRRNAAHYLEALGAHPSVFRPSPEDAGSGDRPCPCRGGDPSPGEGARLVLPFAYPDREATWNQFTVRIPGEGRRDRFRECLAAAGIGTEIYYPLPLGAQPCFAVHDPDPCPNAATVARECVSLPVFPELTPSERGRVVEAVAGWLDAG